MWSAVCGVVKGHTAGFEDWPFLSVHFWGEDPTGEWTLGEATVPFLFHLNSSVPDPDPFLGHPDPDPLVRGMESGSGSFYHKP
jgi:hypothetical protein